MTTYLDLNGIEEIIKFKQRRLQLLKQQEATYGAQVDPGVIIEIQDIEIELKRLHSERGELQRQAAAGQSLTTKHRIANRVDELNKLLLLGNGSATERGFLIKADSGFGKTQLLHELRRQINQSVVVYISLQGNTIDLHKIFSQIGDEIGWHYLPKFTKTVRRYSGLTETVERKVSDELIQEIYSVEDLNLKNSRRAALTATILEDLRALPENVIIIFDTYEEASIELGHWFEQYFLPYAVQNKKLLLIIAGQKVPDVDPGPVETIELGPIDKVDDWKSYCRQHGLNVNDEVIQQFCDQFKGHPKQVAETLTSIGRMRVQ